MLLCVPTLTTGLKEKRAHIPRWGAHLLFCPAQHLCPHHNTTKAPPLGEVVNQGGFLCWGQSVHRIQGRPKGFSLLEPGEDTWTESSCRPPSPEVPWGSFSLLSAQPELPWFLPLHLVIQTALDYPPSLPYSRNELFPSFLKVCVCSLQANKVLTSPTFPPSSCHTHDRQAVWLHIATEVEFSSSWLRVGSFYHYTWLYQDQEYFHAHHSFHVLDSLLWEIPRSEITEAKGTDIIIALEIYCQNAFWKVSANL